MKKTSRKQKREKLSEINFFGQFIKIKEHFFKELNSNLRRIKDPRHQSYVEYGADILIFTLIMKNASGLESMNKMTSEFNREECIENIAKALG